jgi:hypothetical protein
LLRFVGGVFAALVVVVLAGRLCQEGEEPGLGHDDGVLQLVGLIHLKSVSFSGDRYRSVRKDDNSADYDPPHWEDNSDPLDGDAIDAPQDRRYPVAYRRGSNLKLSATWKVEEPARFQRTLVRGVGLDGIKVPETRARLDGTILSITNVDARGTLPGSIRFYNPFPVHWEASVDEGRTWFPAGSSENRIYVILEEPVGNQTRFETLLEIGTRNANGLDDRNRAIWAIWGDFRNPLPGVLRKEIDGHNRPDRTEMTYWRPPETACTTIEQMLASPTGSGTCDAWARLFHGTLRAVGIAGSGVIRVESTYRSDAGHHLPGLPGEARGGMLIREWRALNPGTAPAQCQPLFTHQLVDVQGQPGIAGQGNADPRDSFVEHFIVKVDDWYFDPSYGTGPFGSQVAWEDAAVAYFAKECAIGQQHGPVAKANQPHVETVFTPIP